MLKLLAMAAILAAPTTSPPAAPPAPRCLTRQQAADLSVVAMATTVELVRNACRSHLAATAWLMTPAAADYSARLRGEAERRLDSAMAGIFHMVGAGEIPPRMMESFRREAFSNPAAATEFARYANPDLCSDANEIFEIGATLSPDQMGRLFAAFASLVDHAIRMAPPGAFDPDRNPPTGPSSTPPAATPAPRATPASFDPRSLARPPSAAPGTGAAPSIRPFLCRDGE